MMQKYIYLPIFANIFDKKCKMEPFQKRMREGEIETKYYDKFFI